LPVHVGVASLGFLWSLVTTVVMVALMLTTIDAVGENGFLLYLALGSLTTLSFASVGAILGVRVPRNAVSWLMLATGATFGATFMVGAAVAGIGRQGDMARVGAFLDWVGPIGWYVMAALLWPRLLLLFPDGRLPSRRWRIVDVAQGIAIILLTIGALAPTTEPTFPDPIGIPALAGVSAAAQVAVLALALAFMVLGLAALLVRFNGGDQMARAQLKWMLSTALLLVGGFGLSAFLNPIAPEVADVVNTVAILSLTLVPIAIGIAILRYRLYEIDRIISRTIGWALVTGILVAVFVAVVLTLQALLAGFTQGETLAVAASTLAAFALFQPLRRRIQAAVDHRFNRARYDAGVVASHFANQVREEVDVGAVTEAFDDAVRRTVHPASSVVWIRR
jgi:hypothetical protein